MPSARSLAVLLIAAPALSACDGDPRELLPWRGFYAASHSMEPTLPKGTRLTATKVQPAHLRRGDIVIVNDGVQDRVVRLVGLPGDRVAMVDGRVSLNGDVVPQRSAGSFAIEDEFESSNYAVFMERLPGEARSHRVLDDGSTPVDDTPEVTLGEDEYFLLGDNPDHAADSRMEPPPFGLGIVSGSQITRRVELD